MKKQLLIVTALIGFVGYASCQSQETQQLLLNVEKLTQLKKILGDMKKGYEIISSGYTTISSISKGNFNLHEAFLDGLLQVSPSVRKYRKVGDIISYQSQLVKEYQSAFQRFKTSGLFNPSEIHYMDGIYSNLFEQSLKNMDMLLMVLTAGRLRMSDDERMAAIDRIYDDMADKLSFLLVFNKGSTVLALQRGMEKTDTKLSKRLNGIVGTPNRQ